MLTTLELCRYVGKQQNSPFVDREHVDNSPNDFAQFIFLNL